MSLVLARFTRFVLWPKGIMYPFSVYHGSDLIVSLRREWLGLGNVISNDCPIFRDAVMIDFHPFTIVFSIRWKGWSDFDVLHLFRIDLVIFILCFCHLYCSKTVYSILFPRCTNMRFKSSCLLVCPIILRLLPVLSLTAFWVLIDFHHKVTLCCSIDIGVMFKPCDCICIGLMHIPLI